MDKPNETTFNSALATLQRVDYLLRTAAYYAQSKDLENWYMVITTMSREIYPKLKEKEIQTLEEQINKTEQFVGQHLRLRDSGSSMGFMPAIRELHKLEIVLRKFMDSRGMLLPTKKSPEFDIGSV